MARAKVLAVVAGRLDGLHERKCTRLSSFLDRPVELSAV